MGSPHGYRSYFWPAALVLVGVVALLANTGAISPDRLYQLLDLWPLILIVIGLELIIRRGMPGARGDLAAALVVLLAIGGALAYVAVAPNPGATKTFDSSSSLGGTGQGNLEIDAGAARITIRGADLGSELYRAHIEYSGNQPEITFDPSNGNLKIAQSNTDSLTFFRERRFTLDLTLNASLPWTIVENSGATADRLDFSGMHVGSILLSTGASHDDITLGRASGIVPVTINGGALTVKLHRPSGTAASVSVSGGAVSLDADGNRSRAVGRLSYSTPDFAGANDGYRVEVNGGACAVTLDSA